MADDGFAAARYRRAPRAGPCRPTRDDGHEEVNADPRALNADPRDPARDPVTEGRDASHVATENSTGSLARRARAHCNHTALHLLPRRYAAFAFGAGRLPGCVAGGEAIGVIGARCG